MSCFEQYIREHLKLDRELAPADYEEAFLRMSREERDAAADAFEADPTQLRFVEAVCRYGPFELPE
jgi:hypothetical protein